MIIRYNIDIFRIKCKNNEKDYKKRALTPTYIGPQQFSSDRFKSSFEQQLNS